MRPIRIVLRNFNSTLRIPMPREFKDHYGIRAGDYVTWTEEEDGSVRLQFYKLAEMEQKLAEQEARQKTEAVPEHETALAG